MRTIEVSYNLAAPASKLDIIKYILTNGRHGKLFVSKEVKKQIKHSGISLTDDL